MKKIKKLILIFIILVVNIKIYAQECDYTQTSQTNMGFLTLKEIKVYNEQNSQNVIMTIPKGVELKSNIVSGFCNQNYYKIQYQNKTGWILVNTPHDSNIAVKENYFEAIGEKNYALLALKDIDVYKTYDLKNKVGNISKYKIYEITYYSIDESNNKSLAYIKDNNTEGWIKFTDNDALIQHNCDSNCKTFNRYVITEETTVLNEETNKEEKLPTGTHMYQIEENKYIYKENIYSIVNKPNDKISEPQLKKGMGPILITGIAVLVLLVIAIVSFILIKNKKTKEEK